MNHDTNKKWIMSIIDDVRGKLVERKKKQRWTKIHIQI